MSTFEFILAAWCALFVGLGYVVFYQKNKTKRTNTSLSKSANVMHKATVIH